MNKKVFLCFDPGKKRIGVAVGQSVTATATPLATVRCNGGKPDWPHISKLIKQWQPNEFVVGLPLTMSGERQEATDLAEKFSRQLNGRYLLPVNMADERLSSLEARNRLKDSYKVDPVAAQLILESWLTDQGQREPDGTIPDH